MPSILDLGHSICPSVNLSRASAPSADGDALTKPYVLSHPNVPGVRSCLWRDQRDLLLHDPEPRLWLHLEDGRVLVMRLRGVERGDESILPGLMQVIAEDVGGHLVEFDLPGNVHVRLLYAAPILPLSKHKDTPLASFTRRDMYDLMCELDAEVLDFLGSLRSDRFYLSVRNYNRLAALAPMQRERRLQALQRFPALLAPILLTAHHSANLWDGKRHAWRNPAPEVESVIDTAQNLVGALATHYGISRGLVRSAMNAELWDMDIALRKSVLVFLDTLPANKRPASAEELMHEWPRMQAYLRLFGEDTHGIPQPPHSSKVHAQAFSLGWQGTWHYCDRHAPNLHHALRDVRDFLTAAGRQAVHWLNTHRALSNEQLVSGWLALYGLRGLLQGSMRWHRLRPPMDAEFIGYDLPALLGTWQHNAAKAKEILNFGELVEEGEHMDHCVASYWHACVCGERIFSLQLADGERATAEYVPQQHPHDAFDVHYALDQLRGLQNSEVSAAMTQFANKLAAKLNQHELKGQRAQAMNAHKQWAEQQTTTQQTWLDPRSQHELKAVLAWLKHTPVEDDVWICAHVAGFAYHAGAQEDFKPTAGEELSLHREPGNLHDNFAIRIDWQGQKLGYVPRPNNANLARAMDEGVALIARVRHYDAHAPLWRRLELVVSEAQASRH